MSGSVVLSTQRHDQPLERLLPRLLDAARVGLPSGAGIHIHRFETTSNELAEVRLGARTLVVKRARAEWSREGFRASRRASRLLRQVGVLAPRPIRLPADVDPRPVEAYWRIPLPTLAELWPGLSPGERRQALVSWGGLLRRVHAMRTARHGALTTEPPAREPLERVLRADVADRLAPAAAGCWPAGVPALEALIELLPVVARRGGRRGVLLHGDLHAGNVLCTAGPAGVRCTGVLDLETAMAGPAEADVARASVVHDRLFGRPLRGPWLRHLLRGYRAPPDPLLLRFFRSVGFANFGIHAALAGLEAHARDVARAAEREARSARRLARSTLRLRGAPSSAPAGAR